MTTRVVIAGSYGKHLSRLFAAADAFAAAGAEVLRPTSRNVIDTVPFVRLEGDPPDITAIRELQYAAIMSAELLYVVNPGGLVGSDALIECGFALGNGVAVVFSDVPFETGAQKLATGWGTPLEALRLVPSSTLLPADITLVGHFAGPEQRDWPGRTRTGGVLSIRVPRPGVWQLVHDPDSAQPHLVARRAGADYDVSDPQHSECAVCQAAAQRLLADLEHRPASASIVENIRHG